MEDRCRHCGMAVAFHRIELGKYHQLDAPDLAVCWKCGVSLTDFTPIPVNIWHQNVHRRWKWKLAVLDRGFVNSGQVKTQRLNLLHQLCRIIASHSLAPDLQQYLCDKTNMPYQHISDVKIAFESGASQITLGSIAVSDPKIFIELFEKYGKDKIILGADFLNNKIN